MEFCDNCGGLTYPVMKNGKQVLLCRRCGSIKEEIETVNKESFKILTEIQHDVKDKIEIIKDGNTKTMPTTRAECTKCGHKQVEYWQAQTRSADEGMTTFYRCLKCKHTWRAY